MARIKMLRPPLAQAPRARGWQPDSVRGSRHARGYGWTWEKTRKRILERDKGLCQPCLALGLVEAATEVDHIIGKAEGRARGIPDSVIESDENLQAISSACHREKTARESRVWGDQ